MKTLIGIIVSCQACFGLSAAAFQNLDFNSVRGSIVPYSIPVERAFPGWTAYTGTTVEKEVLYENSFLGSAGLELRKEAGPNGKPNYLAYLISGGSLYGEGNVSASLQQTGTVPADAKSLAFVGGGLGYSVGIDGTTLSLQPLMDGRLAADISAFAGKTVTLQFSANFLGSGPPLPQGFLFVDDIRFSPNALVILVPEPSTWALLSVGGACLLAVSRRRKA